MLFRINGTPFPGLIAPNTILLLTMHGMPVSDEYTPLIIITSQHSLVMEGLKLEPIPLRILKLRLSQLSLIFIREVKIYLNFSDENKRKLR